VRSRRLDTQRRRTGKGKEPNARSLVGLRRQTGSGDEGAPGQEGERLNRGPVG